MPNTIVLSAQEIIQIHDLLMSKFEHECGGILPATVAQKYGFGEYSKDNNASSLRKAISSNTAVVKYLENVNHGIDPTHSGCQTVETKNNLYVKYNNLTKRKQLKENINMVQLTCWMLYLGYPTYDSFKGSKQKSKSGITYTSFFYNYEKDDIMNCTFNVNYDNNPYKVSMEIVLFDKLIEYSGEGRKQNNYLYINLKGNRKTTWQDQFNFVAQVNDTEKPDLIGGMFLCVSSNYRPSSGEMILITNKYNNADDIRKIKRYLFLKRNRHIAKNFFEPKKLKVKKHNIDEIAQMVGHYQVLNFDRNGNLMISKFIIDEFYNARFITYVYSPNENNQICLLNISSVINKRLCISSHPQDGMGIIAYVIINIPKTGEKINKGVFCSVGQTGNMPASGPIVLQMTEKDIEPKKVLKENIGTVMEKDSETNRAFLELVKIVRKIKNPIY